MSGSPAGYSGTPLARKLGIRAAHTVGTVAAPDHLAELLAPLPAGVAPVPLTATSSPSDVILCFVTELATLERTLAPLPDRLAVDGGLWIGWPKQSSPLATDLREADVRRAGLELGLVDNKICAIDRDWSGLRFVFRREDRPRIRAERQGD